TLFKGVNVPSKTLGELAEAAWHPPTIDAETLRGWQAGGTKFGLFDARPPAEFAKMRVPGAVCLPNGELAHRLAAAVADDDRPIVITCAGRTRGLVGAIGLKLAGVGNPVFALENGTQGWALAGGELERGAEAKPFPRLDEAALEASRARARAILARFGIPCIDTAALEAMQADRSRTTYLLDVRSAEEFSAGHLPGAVHAPGGQLVQATDQWIGVQRARVLLLDDTGLRAALAAFWLRQMGWECHVLASSAQSPPPLRGRAREGGRTLPQPLVDMNHLTPISPEKAAAGLANGTHRLLDLRSSQAFRVGRPAGAHWSIRPRLALPPSQPSPARGEGSRALATALFTDDPALAELAAIDLREAGCRDIFLVDGGMEAWRAAGLPVEASPDRPSPEEAIDYLRFVHDRHDGNLESSRRYLAWEQGLVAQLDAAERAEFRLERPAL
ncbi:MAG: hypothetical protein H0T75_16435, partial [Rhizobiales bacterium]|nr:hypothetical protein [Hyphomicrobiales bacterium]